MDSATDDRDAGLCETSQGTLLVTTFTSLSYVKYLDEAEPGLSSRFMDWTARESPRGMLRTTGCPSQTESEC